MADELTPEQRRKLAENGWYTGPDADAEAADQLHTRTQAYDVGGGPQQERFDPYEEPKPDDYYDAGSDAPVLPRDMVEGRLPASAYRDTAPPRPAAGRALASTPLAQQAVRAAAPTTMAGMGPVSPGQVDYARKWVAPRMLGAMASHPDVPIPAEAEKRAAAFTEGEQRKAEFAQMPYDEREARARAFYADVMKNNGVPSMPQQPRATSKVPNTPDGSPDWGGAISAWWGK